ncbi:hypothetical protein GW17_00048880 [Ensete ventricosum]|nr:hypothetical protein GW17_00048880 [Ensete ventricosum]
MLPYSQDVKAGDNCCCYIEVWEQDARAGGEGCCYRSAWEQDAKMVGSSNDSGESRARIIAANSLYSATRPLRVWTIT